MNTALISNPFELIVGLIVGVLFGFILNKAGVTRFSTIVGQLMLKDFTVMKVILTAIATGSVVLYAAKGFVFDVPLVISSTTLFAAFLGGAIFGIGMAVLGFCPGTCVGALSLKAKDAWVGLLGMVVGAGIFAEIFPWIQQNIKPPYLISKITVAEHFKISPWFIIGAVTVLVLLFMVFDRVKQRQSQRAS